MMDDALHDSLARLPERLAESFGRAPQGTRVTTDVPVTEWRIDYTSGTTHTATTSTFDFPLGIASWYSRPRTIEAQRKPAFPALPVAIGHAVFFLALALAGWFR